MYYHKRYNEMKKFNSYYASIIIFFCFNHICSETIQSAKKDYTLEGQILSRHDGTINSVVLKSFVQKVIARFQQPKIKYPYVEQKYKPDQYLLLIIDITISFAFYDTH